MGLFNKIKKLNIFSGLFSVDEDFFEELEESLILSDMGSLLYTSPSPRD